MNLQTQNRTVSKSQMRPKAQEESRLLEVRLLGGLNLILIKGWSISPETKEQYLGALTFIDSHLEMNQYLTVYFKYELFNCSSASYIIKILKKLNGYHHLGKKLTVHWSCGETVDDMLDAGIDFRQFCDFRFKISRT